MDADRKIIFLFQSYVADLNRTAVPFHDFSNIRKSQTPPFPAGREVRIKKMTVFVIGYPVMLVADCDTALIQIPEYRENDLLLTPPLHHFFHGVIQQVADNLDQIDIRHPDKF